MVYDGSSLSTDCATGSGFADTTLRTEVDTIKTFLVAKFGADWASYTGDDSSDEDIQSEMCGSVDNKLFEYKGVVGHDAAMGLTTPGNYFGVLSENHDGDDIFDGISGLWGTTGSNYRGAGSGANNGAAGGMEIRFKTPTAISSFKAHCIKNDGQTLSCYNNGDYDFTKLSVEYYDNGWKEAHKLDGRHSGDYQGSIVTPPQGHQQALLLRRQPAPERRRCHPHCRNRDSHRLL
jgi:hypothetical protein